MTASRADAYDGALSAIRSHADDLSAWLAIWVNRSEPDAHARPCASDAVDAIDAAIREAARHLHPARVRDPRRRRRRRGAG